MKYGFFGGSFNPVTKAHVGLALQICEQCNLDKVIFVPVGNNYNKQHLADEQHRYNMLKIATKQHTNLEVSNIELNLKHNLTTLQAFSLIQNSYPEIDKYFIIGADNLSKITQSKDCKNLIQNYNYIIIERQGINISELINLNEILKQNIQNIKIIPNNQYHTTSSTKARQFLQGQNKYDIKELVTEEVHEYIEENRLYKNI